MKSWQYFLQSNLFLIFSSFSRLSNEKKSIFDDYKNSMVYVVDEDVDDGVSKIRVPTTLSIILIVIVLLAGGVIFSYLRDWYYLQSLYFCFVTLSTIGNCHHWLLGFHRTWK